MVYDMQNDVFPYERDDEKMVSKVYYIQFHLHNDMVVLYDRVCINSTMYKYM